MPGKTRQGTAMYLQIRSITLLRRQQNLKLESIVTKKMSQESSRTENCILGALSELYECLLNPHLGITPDPFRRHIGIQIMRPKKQMSIIRKIILILKWVSLRICPYKNSAQRRLPTYCASNISPENFWSICRICWIYQESLWLSLILVRASTWVVFKRSS